MFPTLYIHNHLEKQKFETPQLFLGVFFTISRKLQMKLCEQPTKFLEDSITPLANLCLWDPKLLQLLIRKFRGKSCIPSLTQGFQTKCH